jgi:hypothetical protein
MSRPGAYGPSRFQKVALVELRLQDATWDSIQARTGVPSYAAQEVFSFYQRTGLYWPETFICRDS